MKAIRNWYTTYYAEITWFLVGFLLMGAMWDFSKGNTTNALLTFCIAIANIVMYRFDK